MGAVRRSHAAAGLALAALLLLLLARLPPAPAAPPRPRVMPVLPVLPALPAHNRTTPPASSTTRRYMDIPSTSPASSFL